MGRIIKTLLKENLYNNIQKIKCFNKDIIWVLKANAYGHGIIDICKELIKVNEINIGLYELNEVLLLDKTYKDINIFVLDGFTKSEWETFKAVSNNINNKIIVTLNILSDLDYAKSIKSPNITFNIFVETGFNWYGLEESNIDEFCKQSIKNNIQIEYISSHFVESDKENSKITLNQVERFKNSLEVVKKYYPDIKSHLGNSNALINNLSPFCNLYRVGRLLYGGEFNGLVLDQIVKIDAEILQIKNVKKGETIGYCCNYTAPKNIKIGIIAAGYKDGIDRILSNKGYFLCKGILCPIIGNIGMNILMIDIRNLDIEEGDYVTFTHNIDQIKITDISKSINMLDYELFTRLSLINTL